MKIAIMAGGTGGHIFPGLAVAQVLKKLNVEVIWFGAIGGMEEKLVTQNNIQIHLLPIKGLRGKGVKGLFQMPFKLLKATKIAKNILKKEKVNSVLSMGGYVAAPGGLGARLQGIPMVVHEQNCVFGMTNKYLSKMAKKVLTGFDLNGKYNSQWVGNPVRDAIKNCKKENNSTSKIRVLIIGGSLGAQSLNTIIPNVLKPYLLNNAISVVHQCGKNKKTETLNNYNESKNHSQQEKFEDLTICEFIDDMSKAYAHADFIIARAGALTIAEINAVGLPSILVPYPHAVDDHQTLNAKNIAHNHAGYIWQESDNKKVLSDLINDFITNPTLRAEMSKNSKKLFKNQASENVAEICMDIAK